MANILSKMLNNRKATSADFAKAADEAAEQMAAAQKRVAELKERRAAALLDASDAEIDKIDAEILKARREAERAEAAQAELVRRAQAAAKAEREAEIAQIFRDAEKAVREGERLVSRYEALATELAAICRRLDEIELQRIGALNLARNERRAFTLPPAERAAAEVPDSAFVRFTGRALIPSARKPWDHLFKGGTVWTVTAPALKADSAATAPKPAADQEAAA